MTTPSITRPLQYADTGNDVLAIQQGLHRAGFTTNARNGNYGDKTVADMSAFQKSVGIDPTGNMGQGSFNQLWPLMSGDQQEGYLSYKPTAPKIIRCLYSADHGDDVKAVQRMLYRTGTGAQNAKNGKYGQQTVADMIAFQRLKKIQATGNMGQPTFTALWQYGNDDDHELYLSAGATAPDPPSSSSDVIRQSLVSNARWYIAHGSSCHYAQVRPYPLTLALPSYTDCSGSTSMFYCVSGGPDPNGRNFDGLGYTGTQRSNGKQVSLDSGKPGDLAFYGDSEGAQHVTMLLGDGRAFSFGSNPPRDVPVTYRPVDMVRCYL